MKRTIRTVVLAAGVVLLSACSSSGGTTVSAGPIGSASSPAGSFGAAPVALDAQTTTWFTTLCQGLEPVSEVSFDMSGQGPASKQRTFFQGVLLYEQAYSKTSSMLRSTPPPTFQGGASFADRFSSELAKSAPKLAALARSVSALNPNDQAALQQASTGLNAELESALPPVALFTLIPPGVLAAVTAIPACEWVGG